MKDCESCRMKPAIYYLFRGKWLHYREATRELYGFLGHGLCEECLASLREWKGTDR